GDPRLEITFPVAIPQNFSKTEVRSLLEQQGYTRIRERAGKSLEVVQDRLRMGNAERARVIEALEAALRVGNGRVDVQVVADEAQADAHHDSHATWKFSTSLHCAQCDIHYQEPTPSLFSFNSPLGACETCRGFGRVIGIDFGLVIPDESKTLREGAIKPWQTQSFKECQDDMARFARKYSVPMDVPWREPDAKHRHWVLEGDEGWISWSKSWPGKWYGVR